MARRLSCTVSWLSCLLISQQSCDVARYTVQLLSLLSRRVGNGHWRRFVVLSCIGIDVLAGSARCCLH